MFQVIRIFIGVALKFVDWFWPYGHFHRSNFSSARPQGSVYLLVVFVSLVAFITRKFSEEEGAVFLIPFSACLWLEHREDFFGMLIFFLLLCWKFLLGFSSGVFRVSASPLKERRFLVFSHVIYKLGYFYFLNTFNYYIYLVASFAGNLVTRLHECSTITKFHSRVIRSKLQWWPESYL